MKSIFISASGLPSEFWITLGAVLAVIVIGGFLASWTMKKSRLR